MKINDKLTQSVAEAVKEVTGHKIAEARMKELHGHIADGKSPEEIIAAMKLKSSPDMIEFIKGLMETEVQDSDKDTVDLHSVDDKEDPEQKKYTEETEVEDEDDVEEGNAFGQAVTDAKKAGKKKFKFQGKEYKVESADLEEAVTPADFVKGGDAKITKREVDGMLSKLFIDTKLAKAVESNSAFKAGEKSNGKKNPYKKDTADFHLFILGQQSADADS
jgi:hypothetical protein